VTYNALDVVRVPFPFTDRAARKVRPAVALSDSIAFNTRAGHSVCAIITSAKHSAWPLDLVIEDLAAAGLSNPCLVRMKLFTLDHRLVLGKLGRLAGDDAARLRHRLGILCPQAPFEH
jgi:mRNA interferase MazF